MQGNTLGKHSCGPIGRRKSPGASEWKNNVAWSGVDDQAMSARSFGLVWPACFVCSSPELLGLRPSGGLAARHHRPDGSGSLAVPVAPLELTLHGGPPAGVQDLPPLHAHDLRCGGHRCCPARTPFSFSRLSVCLPLPRLVSAGAHRGSEVKPSSQPLPEKYRHPSFSRAKWEKMKRVSRHARRGHVARGTTPHVARGTWHVGRVTNGDNRCSLLGPS